MDEIKLVMRWCLPFNTKPEKLNELAEIFINENKDNKNTEKQCAIHVVTCSFDRAWIGKCKKPAEKDLCEEHKGIKCCSCGKQAIRECPETMQLVCGAPLCDDCEHTIRHNGYNSGDLPKGYKSHCKKSEQVYKSWMERENDI